MSCGGISSLPQSSMISAPTVVGWSSLRSSRPRVPGGPSVSGSTSPWYFLWTSRGDRLGVAAVDGQVLEHESVGGSEADPVDILVVVHEEPHGILLGIPEQGRQGVEPVAVEILGLVDDQRVGLRTKTSAASISAAGSSSRKNSCGASPAG